MIICNGLNAVLKAQTDEIVSIGFSEKAEGLHKGHEYLISEAKKKYPAKLVQASVWSDEWKEKNLETYRGKPRKFNKQYMIDWFEDRIDILSFMNERSQIALYNKHDMKSLFSWADRIIKKEGYPHDNLHFLRWVMVTSKIYEEIGYRREYVIMSDKDGSYPYTTQHFYENYIPSIKEVYLVKTLENGGTPYGTSNNNF